MDAVFNFIGMSVADWSMAYRFFTQTLGWQAELNTLYGDWAGFDTTTAGADNLLCGLIYELFGKGRPAANRRWGQNQNVRPAVHVSDLPATIDQLRERGVNFTGKVEHAPWGQQIEFETVEGIRWALAQIPGRPVFSEFGRPQIGHVAIKTADFEAQKDFYATRLGLRLAHAGHDYALYVQREASLPFIILQPGGERIQSQPSQPEEAERAQPFFLSFKTTDIQAAAEHCQRLNTAVLHPVTEHADWKGTDLIVADFDGNPIQIVQYWY